MTWINREAEQELRRWAEHWLADDSQDIDELLDSMHVIDADDEAEAALDRMYRSHDGLFGQVTGAQLEGGACAKDYATIRARLRAARASHTPEEIERAWAMLGKIRSSLCLALGPPCSCWACEAAVPAIAAVLPPRPEPTEDTQEETP